jgi:hypothetical protein
MRSKEARKVALMPYHLVDDLWQDTQEALDRILQYWRSNITSVGLSPDEHLSPKVILEVSPTAQLFSGEIWISHEAFAKINAKLPGNSAETASP